MARVTLNLYSSRMQAAGPAFSSHSPAALPRIEATFTGLHAKSTHHQAHLHRLLQKPKRKRRNIPVKVASNEEMVPAHKYFSEKPPTPLLDTVNLPVHMKNLIIQDLQQLADELRAEVIFSISKTGGHLGSCLGVVDLTVALHYVFNAPEDKILWDATYSHKILTGRRSKMHTMSKEDGLSRFTKRAESAFDAFGGGHSSTTLSAALGMAVARDLQGESNSVVAVIGDGAMTAGQAYEAMNNAGYLDSDLIVILNDNRPDSFPAATSSVLDEPAVVTRYLCPVQLSADLESSKKNHKVDTHQMAAMADGATMFRELGLHYIGPVDGHNMKDLVTILRNVKSIPAHGPVLIHVVTKKGHGYPQAPENAHCVIQFEPATGKQRATETYTCCFGDALLAEAEADSSIVAIHARFGGGAGLERFVKTFPERAFNVGIAEQHAVTFAAGLATEGLKPFCAISSSLLQRGYDQVVHDVDLQKLPVRFSVDSAGLAGEDGATHCGAFDVTYMACLPNMIVMAPADEAELVHMVATAVAIDDRPSCFRFPRGNGIGVALPEKGVPLQIGKGRVLIEGKRVAILGYGSAVQNCVAAHTLLSSVGHSVTVADARFCKHLDGELITRLVREHEILVTVEEGAVGGFSAHVAHCLALHGLLDTKLKWRPMGLPDRYIDQGTPYQQMEAAELSCKHIAATVLECLGDASGDGGDGEYLCEVHYK